MKLLRYKCAWNLLYQCLEFSAHLSLRLSEKNKGIQKQILVSIALIENIKIDDYIIQYIRAELWKFNWK